MLALREVRKSFGEVPALAGMSFDVRPGEVFGFVGGNGAGKTTTMRVVLGVLDADAGTVTWRGRPADRAMRRRIGYMPEERGLYPAMPVRRQLIHLAELHGLDARPARRSVDAWLDRLGVAERAADTVGSLSLGNQQRVQLAAALVHDPELLVLDEPFSGLDPLAVDVMRDVLAERAAAGIPVIFSSHQLELVERVCDRVGIVAAGAMVACGTVDELRRDTTRAVWLDAPGFAADRPGVTTLRQEGGSRLLALHADVDEQQLLAAAVAAGPVHEFRPHRPELAELYRDAVGADPAPGRPPR
jgi:ABC-2 type transport system ATP-binding protein